MTAILNIAQESENYVITEAVRVLREGGLVVFPSDTVYGFLVDAANEKAVDTLIAFKNRAPGKAISVFVTDMAMLHEIVTVENSQEKMLDLLLPGPFTVVLNSKHTLSKKLESEKGTLGVRFIDNPLVQKLMKAYGKPVTATSANLGGRQPHYSIDTFLKQIPKAKKDLVSLIVDAGKLPRNKPSTVIDLTQASLKILRHGDIVIKDTKSYISTTPTQTAKIGAFIIETIKKSFKGKPIVCVIKGDLGAGKTVLVKGMADTLGIPKVVSPTFVVYYEYETEDGTYTQFVHADLYNIQEEEEFNYLGLEEYMKNGTLMCIEWGEKLGKLYTVFQKHAQVIYIEIKYLSEKEREIVVNT